MSDAVNQMLKDVGATDPVDFLNKINNMKKDVVNKGSFEKAAEIRDLEKKFQVEMEKTKAYGLRYNDGKLKWSYVHFKSLEPMVRVLMYGAQKYEPFNWQKGLKKDEILESMMRHLALLMDGESNDVESGLDHIGHIMCNAMFYQYMVAQELAAQKTKEGNI